METKYFHFRQCCSHQLAPAGYLNGVLNYLPIKNRRTDLKKQSYFVKRDFINETPTNNF